MPTTKAGRRLLQESFQSDWMTRPVEECAAAVDAVEAEAANDVVAAWEPIVDRAVAAERARLRERIGKIEEALRIGAICFNGDSWYASRDALGEDGYDLDVAEKIIADALAAVVAIEKGLL